MDEGLIEVEHKGVSLLRRFGEVGRGAGGKGLQHVVIPLNDVLIIVEIDGVESQQLVKRTVNGDIPGLELSNNDLKLFV